MNIGFSIDIGIEEKGKKDLFGTTREELSGGFHFGRQEVSNCFSSNQIFNISNLKMWVELSN